MTQCKGGKHTLREVLRSERMGCDLVAKWCEFCGAVVVDREFDGRIQPGAGMKMAFPEVTRGLVR